MAGHIRSSVNSYRDTEDTSTGHVEHLAGSRWLSHCGLIPSAVAGRRGKHAPPPRAQRRAQRKSSRVHAISCPWAPAPGFSAQVALARTYTTMANAMAGQFGVLLDSSAAAYDSQEAASAALLGRTGSTGGSHTGRDDVQAGAGAAGRAPELSAPAGEVPEAPRDIARLIETGRGGEGRRAWETVETSLRSEAKQLDDTADQLGVAISTRPRMAGSRRARRRPRAACGSCGPGIRATPATSAT